MLLAGIRRRHAYEQAIQGIPKQWEEFMAQLPLPGQLGSTTYGAVCGHDGGGFEYMCAAEVDAFDRLPPGTGRMRVHTQHYAVFLHSGPISGIRATWESALAWLAEGSWQSAHKPDFEVYDQRYDPASKSGEVEIWISVLPK